MLVSLALWLLTSCASFASATESKEECLDFSLASTATELKTTEKSPCWSPKKLRCC